MTANHLRNLEADLWTAADQLRANSKLTATEYAFPVLGLIFLRHAYNRYKAVETEIAESLPAHPQRGRRRVTKDDFIRARAIYLPEKTQWKYIAGRPEGEDIGQVIDEAMRRIEEEYEVLEGVLPKNYAIFEKNLLHRLVRIFNTRTLDVVTGDVFGRIYEYFLNKFAMTGAQEGGEFFTPPSLVNTIVHVIEPDHGIVLDPACGSGGMFVQTAHFLEDVGFDPASKVTFHGQEKADTNTRLAKMNMAVHGLDASILQGNTFYEDRHDLTGKCDFVMANPPFNVDGVDKAHKSVKEDPRLPFGLPRNDNANYLWIQYFYSYLNATGRAGFVMASSASDAGHSEKEIRRQLVEIGAVDVMISIGTKFFYTRSLPCTLWFFDRAKETDKKRRDRTLMLDLREVYRKVSSNLHDFTQEHLWNIRAIVALYRGDSEPFQQAVELYGQSWQSALGSAQQIWRTLAKDKSLDLEKQVPGIADLKQAKRTLNNAIKTQVAGLRERMRTVDKATQMTLRAQIDDVDAQMQAFSMHADTALYYHREEQWLMSRFPRGRYADVPGLCRIVTRDEIAANDYSLTPGRYVGVAPRIDDGFDYAERMAEIRVELRGLDAEATELAKRIQENLEELGL